MFGAGTGTPLEPGEEGPGPDEGGVLTVDELIRLANEAFNNATAAQQNGDWAAYGRYLNELRNYLNQMMPQEEVNPDEQIPTNGTI